MSLTVGVDVGGTKIDYRFVDSYWHGHEYFDNLYERRNTAMLGTKIYWRDSVITAYVTNWEMLLPTDGYEFISPTGQIFTGAGQFHSHAKTGQRRSQLMGNVEQ